MTLSLIVILAWCLGCLAIIPSAAQGAEMSFSGAVTEPTCRDIVTDTARSRTAAPAHPVSCAGPGAITVTPTRYLLSKTTLTANESDPLLRYFTHYVNAGRPASTGPVMLTRAYL